MSFTAFISVKISSQMELHDQAAGHHLQHALDPSRLVGRGHGGIPIANRDPLPGGQLPRQIPLVHGSAKGQTSVGRDVLSLHCFVSKARKN